MIAAIAAVAAWIVTPGEAQTAIVPPADRGPAQPGLPWLSAGAGRITDTEGHTVLLRGFNSEALLETTGGGHAPLDSTDMAAMEAEGFDSVRLPIVWSRLEPDRGRFNTAYLDLIGDTVTRLNAHGLYVILDMHFLDWGARYGGSGAPLWAHISGVPDVRPWAEPWGRHLSPAQNADYTYFWSSSDWQRDFFAAWRFVAQRFRDRSGVAGYDVYNEPHPLPIPPGAFERHMLWPFYAHAITEIGGVDPNHIFIVEATLVGDWGTATEPLAAPDLVYSGHVYTGSLVAPPFTGDPTNLTGHIDDQKRAANQVGAPLWEGELGISHSQSRATAWADAALDHFDDIDVGWSWWQWRQDDGWGIRNRRGTRMDTEFLALLARPYAISAPAGVRAGRGDGVRGRLTVTVGAGVTGTMVLAWPEHLNGVPAVTTTCVSAPASPAGPGRLNVTVVATSPCTIAVAGH